MISDDASFIDLGCGIQLSAPRLPFEQVPGKFVLLDKLLLPGGISELSAEQILIVNRYKETLSPVDSGAGRAIESRQMF